MTKKKLFTDDELGDLSKNPHAQVILTSNKIIIQQPDEEQQINRKALTIHQLEKWPISWTYDVYQPIYDELKDRCQSTGYDWFDKISLNSWLTFCQKYDKNLRYDLNN